MNIMKLLSVRSHTYFDLGSAEARTSTVTLI